MSPASRVKKSPYAKAAKTSSKTIFRNLKSEGQYFTPKCYKEKQSSRKKRDPLKCIHTSVELYVQLFKQVALSTRLCVFFPHVSQPVFSLLSLVFAGHSMHLWVVESAYDPTGHGIHFLSIGKAYEITNLWMESRRS